MACGTPGIAFRRGSVVEVTEDDITGSIVDGEAQKRSRRSNRSIDSIAAGSARVSSDVSHRGA
jgi:hypothetical protein